MRKLYPPHFLVVILSLAAMLAGCTRADDPEMLASENDLSGSGKLRSRSGQVVYDTLPNPYALDVMQQACDSLTGGGLTLLPSDLYVRFLPANDAQLAVLTDSLGLELFDHPMTLGLAEGEEYVDPDLEEGDLGWQYTTVKPGFVCPDSITCEVIEPCYIPFDPGIPNAPHDPNGPIHSNTGINDFYGKLELLAHQIVGLHQEEENPGGGQSRGGISMGASPIHPEGYIKVWDPDQSMYVPVKGVKVRCHNVVKWSTAYTNSDGYYRQDARYRTNCHYAVVFDHAYGFDLWWNWGNVAKANYSMGWQTRWGRDANINFDAGAWPCCMVNNAAADYYYMCDLNGIARPPKNLKIWVTGLLSFRSAPMIRSINKLITTRPCPSPNPPHEMETYPVILYVLWNMNFIRKMLPDVIMGIQAADTIPSKIYYLVNHELGHASHFSVVGDQYWATYVTYILSHGEDKPYGYEACYNAGYCGVGEMWGHAIGAIQEYEKYNGSIPSNKQYVGSEWFKPDVFWDLYRDKVLSKKQIFDCLQPGVTNYYTLVSKMYEKYPWKADEIEAAFANYLIRHNAEKPITYRLAIWSDENQPLPIGAGSVIKYDACIEGGGGSNYSWSAWQKFSVFSPGDPDIHTLSNHVPYTPPTSESAQWIKFDAPGDYVVKCTAVKNGFLATHQMDVWVEGSIPYIMPGTPVNLITLPGDAVIINPITPRDSLPRPPKPIILP